MAQLIATNQLTLTNVIDGKTSYHHWAYSDNADGTGLTLTDNGQRYMGYYTDYTQADSTDKTKYTWTDRWAKIEVGGVNLIKNSRTVTISSNNTPMYPVSREKLSEGSRAFLRLRRTNTTLNPSTFSIYSTINTLSDTAKNYDKGIVSFKARASHPVEMSTMICKVNTSNVSTYGYQRNINITTNWQTFSFEIPLGSDLSFIRSNPLATITDISSFVDSFHLDLCEWQLESGTVATPWQRALEDVQAEIDSKADQALTEQQLNLLTEKAQQMQVELDARATMEALSDLERAYNAYVKANDKAVAKSENDLIEAARRVDAIVETLGGLKKTKTFIDTYITEANEGIIIGTNDNVSQIRVTHDRIAMYSAGKEVMYISQGVIHIDNGVFTKSLQIGRFVTSQHESNPDINICRYVG